MKEEQKKSVLDKYKMALQRGERFWPDSIYKDLLVSLGIFILLILLATFVGVPTEPKANPADTAYVPKPEWYFLFLFKFLALYGQIPVLGKIEWIATAVIPAIALLILFVLPLTDRNPYRHYSRRVTAITVMSVFVVSVVSLTLMADIPTTVLPGLQFLAGLIVPGLAFVILFGLSFFARRSARTIGHVQIWTAVTAAAGMLVLSGLVLLLAPKSAAAPAAQAATTLPAKIAAGQDLYSLNCSMCHGPDGQGGVIQGVQGLDGFNMKAIHSQDEMYTRDDQTLADVISYGQPNLGMQPFGSAYGGSLSPTDIENIVTFMRYTWDDRSQLPAGTSAAGGIPTLNPGEVPSYDVHIAPLVKRYCESCHRPGQLNDNYLVTSYANMLTTGDNAPVLVAKDENSLLLQLIGGHAATDPKTGQSIRQMPPSGLLDPIYVDMLKRWVAAGMPQTAADATKATP